MKHTEDLVRDRLRNAVADEPPLTLSASHVVAAARRQQRRQRVVALAAVSMVAVVAAAGWAATRGTTGPADRPGRAAGHGARPTAGVLGQVPWLPLPATHPQIAKVTIPAVPDPSVAAAAPPCRADQLRVVSNGPGGAGGTDYLLLQVFGRGTEACRLSGTPAVQAMYRGRPADVPVRKLRPDSSTYLGPVLVTATHPAWLRLAWGSMWCARPVATDTVRVTLPGSAGAFSAPGFRGTPYCNGDPGTHVREPIMVGPFQPQHFRLSRIRSPYSPVEAGDYNGVTRVVGSGREVRFAVTLTSKRDVVLDPCPDYTIGVLSLAHTRTYALNCAQVPYKDARGRAYLPAGKPVTFAMRATAPDHPAAGKLSWVLDTPDRTVLAVGALTVKGHG